MRLADSELTSRPAFLAHDGETARLIAEHDWSASLGPIDRWPESLKATVSLMVHSPVPMVLLWGADGIMIYNDAYSVFAGGRHPQLLGSKVLEGWPEVYDLNFRVMQVGLAGGTLEYKDLELHLNRAGRGLEPCWVDVSYSPVFDESRKPGGVIAVVVETTDRVLSDRRLAAASERQRRQFEQAPGFIIIMTGPHHEVEFVNAAHHKVFGSVDWRGKTIREAIPSVEGQGFFEVLDQVYATGETAQFNAAEIRFQRSPGAPLESRRLTFIFAPTTDDSGVVTGIFCEGFDVSDAYRAQVRREALTRLTEVLRDLDDMATIAGEAARVMGEALAPQPSRVGYGTVEDEAHHVERDWTSPGVPSHVGVAKLREYGSFVDDLRQGEIVAIPDVRADPRTADFAERIERRYARSFVAIPVIEQSMLVAFLFLTHAEVREWSDEELALAQEVADRTRTAVERARSQAALRASLDNFQTLATVMPNQVWTAGPDGRLDWFNEQVYAYSGAAPGTLDGDSWTRIVHSADLPGVASKWGEAVSAGDVYRAEFRILRADGAWRWHIARATPVRDEFGQVSRWIGANTDIHDQKEVAQALEDINATLEARVEERTRQLVQAQDALRQAQKMEAVGQLTGGIAHDFNNLLAGISGSLEMLERRMAEGKLTGAERYIDAAQGAARRAAALTQRLLAFSRRQTLDPKAIDANRLIAGMEDLIRRTVGPNIEVEVVGAGGLWTTRVDPSQLENALLNLCINARDAMAPDGGRLTIETANKWLDERAAKARDLPPGQYISLCVTDTGAGMTDEVKERAFDPFFTTKPLGQGTGLGLSMIYGFVRQSGGQVRIYSELGSGTTMCLYLPRHFGDADPEQEVEIDLSHHGHGETVLVIDDEDVVRMLIVDVLEENGYLPLEAVDGPSGMRILESDARIDLLITDVGLPGGMNGRQIADAARLLRPGLKVLFVTGYAENAVVGNGHLDPGMEIITKPFSTSAMGARIRDLIDRR